MNARNITILVIEPDSRLRSLWDFMAEKGYNVEHLVCEGSLKSYEIEQKLSSVKASIVFLCRLHSDYAIAVRAVSQNLPIVCIGSVDEVEKLEKFYEAGIDDYITLPIHPLLLMFKVKAIMRRFPVRGVQTVRQLGRYAFNVKEQVLVCPEKTQHLTPKEAEVLEYLFCNLNDTVTKKRLLLDIWGKTDQFVRRSLDVYIYNLRKYLCFDERIKLLAYYNQGVSLKFSE